MFTHKGRDLDWLKCGNATFVGIPQSLFDHGRHWREVGWSRSRDRRLCFVCLCLTLSQLPTRNLFSHKVTNDLFRVPNSVCFLIQHCQPLFQRRKLFCDCG